eukprot:TRINITY_DN644_c0_g2_i1.p1 TRINITY_DN644_c0_g2~~TRINITY_DN644_c0_g2_i1.p1  ORF type:complete len:515 (-),score=138.78 TRINITY_DN644_c0_g2_i1:83-1627(-)
MTTCRRRTNDLVRYLKKKDEEYVKNTNTINNIDLSAFSTNAMLLYEEVKVVFNYIKTFRKLYVGTNRHFTYVNSIRNHSYKLDKEEEKKQKKRYEIFISILDDSLMSDLPVHLQSYLNYLQTNKEIDAHMMDDRERDSFDRVVRGLIQTCKEHLTTLQESIFEDLDEERFSSSSSTNEDIDKEELVDDLFTVLSNDIPLQKSFPIHNTLINNAIESNYNNNTKDLQVNEQGKEKEDKEDNLMEPEPKSNDNDILKSRKGILKTILHYIDEMNSYFNEQHSIRIEQVIKYRYGELSPYNNEKLASTIPTLPKISPEIIEMASSPNINRLYNNATSSDDNDNLPITEFEDFNNKNENENKNKNDNENSLSKSSEIRNRINHSKNNITKQSFIDDFFDSDNIESEKDLNLTDEQKEIFEEENQSLLKNFENLVEQVRYIDKQIAEISLLQDQFVSEVSKQADDIDNLHYLAVVGVSHITKAAETLRDATKEAVNFRIFILVLIICLSFGLLFKQWYD